MPIALRIVRGQEPVKKEAPALGEVQCLGSPASVAMPLCTHARKTRADLHKLPCRQQRVAKRTEHSWSAGCKPGVRLAGQLSFGLFPFHFYLQTLGPPIRMRELLQGNRHELPWLMCRNRHLIAQQHTLRNL